MIHATRLAAKRFGFPNEVLCTNKVKFVLKKNPSTAMRVHKPGFKGAKGQ
jgi:hypothetical protein